MPDLIRPSLEFYDEKKRPWPNERLERAIIVGHTTVDTAKIWVRVSVPGHYYLLVSPNAFPSDPSLKLEVSEDPLQLRKEDRTVIKPEIAYSGNHDIGKSTDLTHVFKVNKLKTNARYYCAVFLASDDSSAFDVEVNNGDSFKTLPEETPEEFSFGLFSCHMPYPSKEAVDVRMWKHFYNVLSSNNARFLIAGGDQVYTDGIPELSIWEWLKENVNENPTLEEMRSWYRDIYRGYWGFCFLQKIFASFPTYMTWDDHDIKDGWGSYKTGELSRELNTFFRWDNQKKNLRLAYQMFEAAKLTYDEYQHSHNPDTHKGVLDFPIKNAGGDFYVLDARGCRDFQRSKNRILGLDQTNRFMDWLSNLQPSEFGLPIFLVASVPFVHLRDFVAKLLDWFPILGGQDDVRDHWLHKEHRSEINPIVNALFETSDRTQRPLVILSGDVHVGTVFKLKHKDYPNANVSQVTSSGITTYARMNQYKMIIDNLHNTIRPEGEVGETGVQYKLLHSYIQNNVGLIKLRLKNNKLHNLFVQIHGKSTEAPKLSEYYSIDLLPLLD